MWATEQERDERFEQETHPTYDFRVRDEWDLAKGLWNADSVEVKP
jgi:hypothetical protein